MPSVRLTAAQMLKRSMFVPASPGITMQSAGHSGAPMEVVAEGLYGRYQVPACELIFFRNFTL